LGIKSGKAGMIIGKLDEVNDTHQTIANWLFSDPLSLEWISKGYSKLNWQKHFEAERC
jgi:hypothetical protein